MRTKRAAALLCAAMMTLSAASCKKSSDNTSGAENIPAVSSAQNSVKEEPVLKTVLPSEDNVKSLGRTFYMKEQLYCTFSGSGAAFSFTGTECTVHVTGDTTAEGTDNQARVAIYVNGERVIDDMVDKPEEVYSVFKSDTEQDVEVQVIKLSEAPMSAIAIGPIDYVGSELRPAALKERYIEFVGDSVTCGYGVDDEDRNHHFSTTTEDVTKAYAYKTAQNLNADYSMVCFSGHGIISGYTNSDKKVSAQTVPKYYTNYGYTYGTIGTFRPKYTQYDFTKRQPDVVVLFLGINDDSYCKSIEERREEYRSEYVSFLKTIHENNPDAQIICCMGVLSSALYPKIEQAVQDFIADTGHSRITSVLFDGQLEEDGIAADWHPSEKTHNKVAAALTAKIKEIMNW